MASAGSQLYSSGLNAFVIPRARISAVAAANALTIAIKNATGNDPSPADPLYTAMPITLAEFEGRTIAAPLSLTIPAGATFGVGANEPFRIWLELIDDGAGTLYVGAINCLGTGAINISSQLNFPTASVTAINTNADFSFIFYSSATLANKSIRTLGFLEWSSGLATPGNWTNPDIIQMDYAGMKRPGDLVASVRGSLFGAPTGTTLIPYDDTIPQITEGDQYSQDAITPTSGANLIEYEAVVDLSHTVATPVIAALFINSVAAAVCVAWTYVPVAFATAQLVLKHSFRAATTSQRIMRLRIGGANAGTLLINGGASGRLLGGIMPTKVKIDEVMG